MSSSQSSSSSEFPARSLGFNILLLRSQLDLWGSPFFFFFVFPARSLGFTILLLLLRSPAISLGFTILLLMRSQLDLWGSTFFFFRCSQLDLWGSPFFFLFCCVPSYISGGHHSSSSSSAFPAISLGFTSLLLFCVPS